MAACDCIWSRYSINIGLAQFVGEVVGLIVGLFYFIKIPASRWQATPGMRMMDLYVVTDRGEPVGYAKGFVRILWIILPCMIYFAMTSSFSIIIWAIGIFILNGVVAVIRKDGRTITDMLSSTRIVTGRPEFVKSRPDSIARRDKIKV